MRIWIISIALFGWTAIAAFAQQPPPDIFDADSGIERTENQSDELVRQLLADAARGGLYRARSLQRLARINSWSNVDRVLTEFDSIADQQELAAAAQEIGTEYLLQISLHPGLSDQSKSAIRKIIAAADASNQAPAKIQAAIKQLASDDADGNLAANRVLLRAGNAGTTAMVSSITQGLEQSHQSKLIAILRSQGANAYEALEQLALYGSDAVRPHALIALRQLDADRASDNLVAAAFSSHSTPDEREAASGRIPIAFETLDAIALLHDRLRTLRELASRAPNDATPATMWLIDDNRSSVRWQRTTEVYLRYRLAYDAATRLQRIGSLPPVVARHVLAANVAYRTMVDVDWPTEEQLDEARRLYQGRFESADLLLAFEEQRQDGNTPAALGLLRLFSIAANEDAAAEQFLRGRKSGFSALVEATQDPTPRIRYEASAVITQILSKQGVKATFPGSSFYRKTLSEMSRLGADPTAIVIESRPVVALRQESNLQHLGIDAQMVVSAGEAEREIAHGGDLRMVVSKLGLPDAHPAELVDRIRRHPKGSRVPIVIYSDADSHEKSLRSANAETTSGRWISEDTPRVYVVPLPGSPAAFSEVLSEIQSKRRLPPLSIGDRTQFRSIGLEALEPADSPTR